MQNPNGSWPFTDNFNPDYTTVLVLDALELAEGGDKVTFTPNFKMADSKKDNSEIVTKTDDLSIDEKTQTIFYKGKKIPIGGGGATWALFMLLYEKRGEIVTLEKLRDSIGIHDVHKIKFALLLSLRDKGGKELAEKIKNSHSVGYYLES